LPDEWLTAYVGRVEAVTAAQVSDLARTHLPDERMTIVVVGDRELIEEQVKPFGPLK
jgi:predicted Zn-dependent peptidase